MSDTYRCVEAFDPVDDLPPVEPSRCTLKPPSYFESCAGALATVADGLYPPLGPPEQAEAWGCAFGDGDGDTPNHLYWFESCDSPMPLRCE